MTHPAVRDLIQSLARHEAFQDLIRRLLRRETNRLSLSGLTNTAKALYLVLLWQTTERPLAVIVDGNKQAETLGDLITAFFNLLVNRTDIPHPQTIPAYDILPHQKLSPHTEIAEQRAIGLWRLATQRVPLTLAPVASALLKTESADFYRQLAVTLRVGEETPLDVLAAHLESIGYERREPVEMTGEYSIRGGIFDIFPAESARPVRVEFFGDEIESIRRFDVETQRSVLKVQEASILPLAEYPKSAPLFHDLAQKLDYEGVASPGDPFPGWEFAVPLARPRTHTLFSLASDAVIVLDEPEALAGAGERLWKRLSEPAQPAASALAEANFYRWEELTDRIDGATQVAIRELELGAAEALHISTRPSMSFHGSMQVAVAEAKSLVEQGNRVAFFAPSTGELERLADILQEYSVPFQLGLEPSDQTPAYLAERAYIAGSVASTFLIKGNIAKGAIFPESRVALFGSEDLFDSSDLIARPGLTKSQLATFGADLADLK
ncbi:MAG: transcription-repair coupling factor, partial [Bryobacteraceae bacterium]